MSSSSSSSSSESSKDPQLAAAIREYNSKLTPVTPFPFSSYEDSTKYLQKVVQILPNAIYDGLKSHGLEFPSGIMGQSDVRWLAVQAEMPVTFAKVSACRDNFAAFLPVGGIDPKDLIPSQRVPKMSYEPYVFAATKNKKPPPGHRAYYLKCQVFIHSFFRYYEPTGSAPSKPRFRFSDRDFNIWRDFLVSSPLAELLPTMQIKIQDWCKFVLDFDNVPIELMPVIVSRLQLPECLGAGKIAMTFWRKKSDTLGGLHVFHVDAMTLARMKQWYDRVADYFQQNDLPVPDGQIYGQKLRAPGCFGMGKSVFDVLDFHSPSEVTVPYFTDIVPTFSTEINERCEGIRRACRNPSCRSAGPTPFWSRTMCIGCIIGVWDVILANFYPVHLSDAERSRLHYSTALPVVDDGFDPSTAFPIYFPRDKKADSSPYSFARNQEGKDPIHFFDIPDVVSESYRKNLFQEFTTAKNFAKGWKKFYDDLNDLQNYVAVASDNTYHGFGYKDPAVTLNTKVMAHEIGKAAEFPKLSFDGFEIEYNFPGVEEVYRFLKTTALGTLFIIKMAPGQSKKDPRILKIAPVADFLVKVFSKFVITPYWHPYPIFNPNLELMYDKNNTYHPPRTPSEMKALKEVFEKEGDSEIYMSCLRKVIGVMIVFFELTVCFEKDTRTKTRLMEQFWRDVALKAALPAGFLESMCSTPRIPLIIGAQSTCKTLITSFLVTVFGEDLCARPKAVDAPNTHASAYLKNKLLAVWDEAKDLCKPGAGHYDRMKESTNATVSINQKYRNVITVKNMTYSVYCANLDLTSIGNSMTPEDRRLNIFLGDTVASPRHRKLATSALDGITGMFFNYISSFGIPSDLLYETCNDVVSQTDTGQFTYETGLQEHRQELTESIFKVLKNISEQASDIRAMAEGNEEAKERVSDYMSGPAIMSRGKLKIMSKSCPGWVAFLLGIFLMKGVNTSCAIKSMPLWVLQDTNKVLWETPVWCRVLSIEHLQLIYATLTNPTTTTRASATDWESLVMTMMRKEPRPRTYTMEEFASKSIDDDSFFIREKNGTMWAWVGDLATARQHWAQNHNWGDFDFWPPAVVPKESPVSAPLADKFNGKERKGVSNYGKNMPYEPPPFSEDLTTRFKEYPHLQVSAASTIVNALVCSRVAVGRLMELFVEGFDTEFKNYEGNNDALMLSTYAPAECKQWEETTVRLKRHREASLELGDSQGLIPVSSSSSSLLLENDSQDFDDSTPPRGYTTLRQRTQ